MAASWTVCIPGYVVFCVDDDGPAIPNARERLRELVAESTKTGDSPSCRSSPDGPSILADTTPGSLTDHR